MNLEGNWLYTLTLWLWPEIADMDDRQQTQSVLGMIPLIYLLPFALFGFSWLILVTDLSQLSGSVLSHLLLLGALLLLLNNPFNIYVGLGGGANIALSSSLAPLVLWATVLISGPSGLWVVVVAEALTNYRLGWQLSRFQNKPFWGPLSRFVQELSNSVFATLVAFQVYQFLGGTYPLSSSEPSGWVPAFMAIAIGAFLPGLLILPMAITINRLTNTPNNIGRLARLEFGVVGISLLMAPFSILVAILFAEGRTAALVFVLAGVVLINWLANHLSRARDRSDQQAREFSVLEELGETLLQGPADASILPEILSQFISRMFPQDRVEVRLFEPDDDQNWAGFRVVNAAVPDPVSDDTWQQMCVSSDPFTSFSRVILPGTNAIFGDALAVKIISLSHGYQAEAALCIGGVYLLRQTMIGKSGDSLAAVRALASQVASAIYRAEVHAETMTFQKVEQELEFAGRVQNSFLPSHVPEIEGWQLSAILEPARQTSGDFYDFVYLSDSKLGIVVADVSDKGTGAALYMALSRTLIRTYAMEYDDKPSLVLSMVNERLFSDSQSDQFVTVFYGVLDTYTGAFTYSNAGHNPSYVFRANNGDKPESLGNTGIPLGMFEGMVWEQEEIQLLQGDLLLMYTDGLAEAQDHNNILYDDRLLATGRENLGRSAKEIEEASIQSINDFVGDAPQFDDITLLVAVRR